MQTPVPQEGTLADVAARRLAHSIVTGELAQGQKLNEAELAESFRRGGLRYSAVKKDLVERIWKAFEPHRERRRELSEQPQLVRDVLARGAEKARLVAKPPVKEGRRRVGADY